MGEAALRPAVKPARQRPDRRRLASAPRAAMLALAVALAMAAAGAGAKDAAPLVADPALEARVMALAAELRCLVCQNQTIADSHADLALDLRQQIREQLSAGKSEDDIRRYMTDRYGDFVLYKPPLKPTTALLWAGPAVLLAGALAGLLLVLRRRQRLGAEAFDPDTPDLPEQPGLPDPHGAHDGHGLPQTARGPAAPDTPRTR